MKFTTLLFICTLFGLAYSKECEKYITLTNYNIVHHREGWKNCSIDLKVIRNRHRRRYIRPASHRRGSKLKVKGPHHKQELFWTMIYRSPAAMFARKTSRDGRLLFMSVNEHDRIVMVKGEVPTDLSMDFLNRDPRVFKYDFAVADHPRFILGHPASNKYVKVNSKGVMRLSCKVRKAVNLNFEGDM